MKLPLKRGYSTRTGGGGARLTAPDASDAVEGCVKYSGATFSAMAAARNNKAIAFHLVVLVLPGLLWTVR